MRDLQKVILLTVFLSMFFANATISQVEVPQALPASDIRHFSFVANWRAVSSSSISAYQLYVSNQSDFSVCLSGFNGRTVYGTSFSIENLSASSTYYYRVQALSFSFGTSAYSNTISVQTLLTPPAPVALAPQSVTSNSFLAKWTPVTDATDYLIDVSTSPSFSSFVPGYFNKLVSTINLEIMGLMPNTNYYFRVTSVVGVAYSLSSNIINATTLPAAPIALPPSDVSRTAFTANWMQVAGVNTYYLEVATDRDFSNLVAGFTGLPITALSFIVQGLIPDRAYFYRVRALGLAGLSAYSNVVLGTENAPNYVLTTDVMQKGVSNIADVNNLSKENRSSQYRFFDGLGRVVQVVDEQKSPLGKDLVHPVSYDNFGREDKKWLPYTSSESDGRFKPNAILYNGSEQSQFYANGLQDKVQDDTYPYSKITFEDSPLSRVKKNISVGQSWHESNSDVGEVVFYQAFNWSDFVVSALGGGGDVKVTLRADDGLMVQLGAGFSSSALKTGAIKYLDTNVRIDDCELGTFANGQYKMYVRNNFLFVEALTPTPAVLGGFSAVFQVPGKKAVRFDYQSNRANDVIVWRYDQSSNTVTSGSGSNREYYPSNVLRVTKKTDEQNFSEYEYRDFDNRLVLKRVQSSSAVVMPNDADFASTYYVYDDYDNLIFVLPPEAVKALTQN